LLLSVTILPPAANWVAGQSDVADLREDVRGLTQRVGELSLRVEQLERQNADLQGKLSSADSGRGAVTPEQLNRAVADLNASITSAVATSRSEILEQVATQMEKLAKQTNAALDAISRQGGASVQAGEGPAPARQAPEGSPPRDGVSYTVVKGDSIGIIARKTGARVQDIVEANKLTDPSRIQAGQVLIIPGGH
jgi:LysM repeat protein